MSHSREDKEGEEEEALHNESNPQTDNNSNDNSNISNKQKTKKRKKNLKKREKAMESRLYVRDGLLRNVVRRWGVLQAAVEAGGDGAAEEESLQAALGEYSFAVERAEAAERRRGREKRARGESEGEEGREKEAEEKMARARAAYRGAKAARANHEEYEKLAELISKYPSREETVATVVQLRSEIAALQEEKKAAEKRLAEKNAQFQLLLHAIRQLQTTGVVVAHQRQPQQQQKEQQQQQQKEAEEIEEGQI